MKTLTTVLLFFIVFMAFTVEADAGSFNLSVSFDPGITIGRGHHSRRHRAHVRDEENSTDAAELPPLDQIHQFKVPDVFVHDANRNGNDNDHDQENPSGHHGGPHRHRQRH